MSSEEKEFNFLPRFCIFGPDFDCDGSAGCIKIVYSAVSAGGARDVQLSSGLGDVNHGNAVLWTIHLLPRAAAAPAPAAPAQRRILSADLNLEWCGQRRRASKPRRDRSSCLPSSSSSSHGVAWAGCRRAAFQLADLVAYQPPPSWTGARTATAAAAAGERAQERLRAVVDHENSPRRS